MLATEDSGAMRAALDNITSHRSGSQHLQSSQDRALAASRPRKSSLHSIIPTFMKSPSAFAAQGLAEGNAITDDLAHLAMRNKVQVRTSDGYRLRLEQCGMVDPVAGLHGVIVKVYDAGAPGDGFKCDVMWDSGRGLTGYHTRAGFNDLVVAPARGSSKDLLGENGRASPEAVRPSFSTGPSASGSILHTSENLILDVTVGYLGQAPPPIPGGVKKSLWAEHSFQEELKQSSTPKGHKSSPPSLLCTPKAASKPCENAKSFSDKLAKQLSNQSPLSQFTLETSARAEVKQQSAVLQQFVPTGNTPQKAGYKRPASNTRSPTGPGRRSSVSTVDSDSSPPGSAAPMASSRSSVASTAGTVTNKLPAPSSSESTSLPKQDLDATSEEEEAVEEGEASWDGQMGYV